MVLASGHDITAPASTSQNIEIFLFAFSEISSLHLHTIMSGLIPAFIRSLTECCVGLVFSSPTAPVMGTSVQWMRSAFSSRPISRLSCLAASRNGMDSMSPTVPPSSTMATSASESLAAATMRDFISSVMWGIICTVLPRYSPLRSFSITER